MYTPEMRRALLESWSEQFKRDYRFDTRNPVMVSTMYMALSAAEEGLGPVSMDEEWAHTVPKSDLYEAGRAVASKWGMPLSQFALVTVAIGAKTVDEVKMILAYVYKQYLKTEKNPQESMIDVQTVWNILRQGVPSGDFMDKMWGSQIIGGYRSNQANLLDVVTAEDFGVSTPEETVV